MKLLLLEHEDGHANVAGSTSLMGAIKTILVADAVMSLDNVIAVAGVAKGSMALVTDVTLKPWLADAAGPDDREPHTC